MFSASYTYASDVIVSDKSFHISKDTVGASTEISIEFISEYENNLEGIYPNRDFVTIDVDVNANAKLDSKIDRSYGETYQNKPCASLLITRTTSLTCGSYKSGVKVFHYFLKTEVNPMPHPVIKFLIPTDELISSISKDRAFMLFTIYSARKPTSYYPSKQAVDTFSNAYKIRL
jgi:hypothetical protein